MAVLKALHEAARQSLLAYFEDNMGIGNIDFYHMAFNEARTLLAEAHIAAAFIEDHDYECAVNGEILYFVKKMNGKRGECADAALCEVCEALGL
jgi:hypothetical protein